MERESRTIEIGIKRIFSRHIAKTLGFIEAGGFPTELKAAVKSEFWFTAEDVLSKLTNEGVTIGEKRIHKSLA